MTSACTALLATLAIEYAKLTEWLRRAVRVNETDTFADEEGLNDEYFDFEDISGDNSI